MKDSLMHLTIDQLNLEAYLALRNDTFTDKTFSVNERDRFVGVSWVIVYVTWTE